MRDRETKEPCDRVCDECSHPFVGEYCHDWCAICLAAKPDPLSQKWACTTCSTTFEAGRLRLNARGQYGCPNCGAETISGAHGETRTLDAYYGEIGTRN